MEQLSANKFMERKEFQKFYDDSIRIIAATLCDKHKSEGFDYIQNFESLYEAYLNQWYYLRMLLKGTDDLHEDGSRIEDDKTLLDGHKSAAAITTAISQVRVIYNHNIKDTKRHPYSIHTSYRINEQLAILCGLHYLYGYMFEKSKKAPDELKIDLNHDFEMIWPITDYGTPQEPNHYLDSLIRGIYYSNLGSNANPILLAHIYFLIEQYHRKSIKLEQLKIKHNITD